MILPPNIPIFGDPKWRGKCPKESVDQISVVNRIRREYPDTWGRLLIHVRNEDEVASAQAMRKRKLEGLVPGASDLNLPARTPWICEIKRRDHTLSRLSDEQLAYLVAAQNAGAFACIALGAVGAWEAFTHWLTLQNV